MANSVATASANGARSSYSNHTLEKVAKAKATLESFYANLITQHQERKNRLAAQVGFTEVPVSDFEHGWPLVKIFQWNIAS